MTLIQSLEKVQIGLEAVWGDGATPTIELTGITDVRVTPKVESERVADKRGTRMPAHRSVLTRRWSEAQIDGFLTYPDAQYWLDAAFGIETPALGVTTWLANLDEIDAPRTLNLAYGQAGAVYEAPGLVLSELTVSFATAEPAKFSSKWAGLPVADGAFAELTAAEGNLAMGSQVQLFIDPIAGTLGATEIETTAFRAEAKILTGRGLVYHLGGAKLPTAIREGKWDGSVRLVLEMTEAMKVLLDEILDETDAQAGLAIRLKATSPDSEILVLDFAGEALSAPQVFTYEDGIVTVELDLSAKFSEDATFESCWGASLTIPGE